MKSLFLYVLAVALAVFSVVLAVNYSTPTVYSGTDIKINLHDYNTMVIDDVAQVNFEAASTDFYAMHQGSDALIGTLSKAPVGWKSSYNFATAPTIINAGNWVIDDGDYSVHMSSDTIMRVTIGKTMNDVIKTTILIVIVGIFVWFVIYMLTVMPK